MGLNSRTKSTLAGLQRDLTSQQQVTSGHTPVRQNHGHGAGQEHRNAPTSTASVTTGICRQLSALPGLNRCPVCSETLVFGDVQFIFF